MTDNRKVTVEFTIFNMLELLRGQIEDREKELAKVEAELRDILFEMQKIRYLQSLDPFYQKNVDYPENYKQYPDMEQRREDLIRVIGILKQQMTAVQAKADAQARSGGGAMPQPEPAGEPESGGAKRRFDDFDSWRRKRGS